MTTTLVDGLCFGEGPRWRDGKLWFSDMHGRTVYTVGLDGQLDAQVRLDDDEPSGLGWLPDGRLLIVSMRRRCLLTWDGSTLSVFCDLSGLASWHCNDMVTDQLGRSWVGNFGFDLHNFDPNTDKPRFAEIILVTPDGKARMVADEMRFPNGTVITPDGKTLIVGESTGRRLTAFDLADDGSLSNRRVWAEMNEGLPDGICLDEAGGIWVASPEGHQVLRIIEGGEITHRVKVKRNAYACMLGGEDGKTLFILTSGDSQPDICVKDRNAAVEVEPAPYAGAGCP